MPKPNAADVHDSVEGHSKLFRDLLLGFVKIHVLHHAALEPIYGSGISAELERHGYRLSWGTLYPLLHNLEAAGFLAREERVVDGKVRKYYGITPVGRRALDEARRMALELVEEITEDGAASEPEPAAAASGRRRRPQTQMTVNSPGAGRRTRKGSTHG
jgi:DNA-binding PadR family transcriptional regulator